MKMVIDIPKGLHTNIVEDNCSMADMRILLTVIKNGTPIPKGHGDLIDKEELLSAVTTIYGQDAIYSGLWNVIDNQPTIIEADKEVDR